MYSCFGEYSRVINQHNLVHLGQNKARATLEIRLLSLFLYIFYKSKIDNNMETLSQRLNELLEDSLQETLEQLLKTTIEDSKERLENEHENK